MKEWIFKIIYYPIGIIMAMIAFAIIGMMFKDVGWEQPFRWLVFIGILAYFADKAVNK
jgi:uncharacterized membrane protein